MTLDSSPGSWKSRRQNYVSTSFAPETESGVDRLFIYFLNCICFTVCPLSVCHVLHFLFYFEVLSCLPHVNHECLFLLSWCKNSLSCPGWFIVLCPCFVLVTSRGVSLVLRISFATPRHATPYLASLCWVVLVIFVNKLFFTSKTHLGSTSVLHVLTP